MKWVEIEVGVGVSRLKRWEFAMKNTYMFTGFPGFLSFYLLRDLLLQKEKELKRVYLLVLPTMLERARQELRRLTAMRPEMSSLFTLLPGDITKWNLETAS